MDDYRRKFIFNDCSELYNTLKEEIENNPTIHFNKKYRVGVSTLHSLLEDAQEEFTKMKEQELNKSSNILSSIPIDSLSKKIPALGKLKKFIPQNEYSSNLDNVLGKASIQAAQLRNCRNCTCLNCNKDNCKASCFVCHSQSYVIYCNDLCIRTCSNWNIIIQGEKYIVKYMAIFHVSNRFYLVVKKKGEKSMKMMIYNPKNETVRYPQEENLDEINSLSEAIKSIKSNKNT